MSGDVGGKGSRPGDGPDGDATPGDPDLPSLAEHVTRRCLACDAPDVAPAMVLSVEGALPGTPEHGFAYEHDVVVACGSCGALRLESWRHDCFDFEDWFDRHWYFPVAGGTADRLRRAVEACPAPLDPGCGCAIHASLVASLDGLPPRSFGARRQPGVQPPVRVEGGLDRPRFVPGGGD